MDTVVNDDGVEDDDGFENANDDGNALCTLVGNANENVDDDLVVSVSPKLNVVGIDKDEDELIVVVGAIGVEVGRVNDHLASVPMDNVEMASDKEDDESAVGSPSRLIRTVEAIVNGNIDGIITCCNNDCRSGNDGDDMDITRSKRPARRNVGETSSIDVHIPIKQRNGNIGNGDDDAIFVLLVFGNVDADCCNPSNNVSNAVAVRDCLPLISTESRSSIIVNMCGGADAAVDEVHTDDSVALDELRLLSSICELVASLLSLVLSFSSTIKCVGIIR
jgi:hypothetical protein